MKRDIVIIPTFYRPEYLYLCLERILHNPRADREIWLVQDRHTDDFPRHARDEEGTELVCSCFGKHLNLRRIVRRPHNYPGNSYNVLEAYRAAYQTDARYVYLIEEDVLVTEDFFRWHETVQGLGDYFCSIGYRCMRNPYVKHVDDPEGYLECARDYASIGVCWRRTNLAAVAKHARAGYYRDTVGYLLRRFPNSGLPSTASEQDGLILRLTMADKRPTAWASLPRAYHIGVGGYHRRAGFRFPGALNQRVHAMREAATSTAALLRLSSDPFNDVEAPPARVPTWTMQKVIQRLN
jgi:hypothetical protein